MPDEKLTITAEAKGTDKAAKDLDAVSEARQKVTSGVKGATVAQKKATEDKIIHHDAKECWSYQSLWRTEYASRDTHGRYRHDDGQNRNRQLLCQSCSLVKDQTKD